MTDVYGPSPDVSDADLEEYGCGLKGHAVVTDEHGLVIPNHVYLKSWRISNERHAAEEHAKRPGDGSDPRKRL